MCFCLEEVVSSWHGNPWKEDPLQSIEQKDGSDKKTQVSSPRIIRKSDSQGGYMQHLQEFGGILKKGDPEDIELPVKKARGDSKHVLW